MKKMLAGLLAVLMTFSASTLPENVFFANIGVVTASAETWTSVIELTNDMTINGSVETDSDIILNGHTLTVNGNLYMTSGMLDMCTGKLIVNGSLYIGKEYASSNAYIRMQDSTASINVSGDFVWNVDSKMKNPYGSNTSGLISAGTINVGGGFYDHCYDSNQNSLYLTGTTLLNLNGTGIQTVSCSANGIISNFNVEDGREVDIEGYFYLNKPLMTDLDIVTYSVVKLAKLDMNGHDVSITGDVIQNDKDILLKGGKLEISGYFYAQHSNTELGGGTLDVGGNYYLANVDKLGKLSNTPAGLLMTNSKDVMRVGGNVEIRNTSSGSYKTKFTSGKVYIAGSLNTTSSSSYLSFGSGNTVYLNGSGEQTVKLANSVKIYNLVLMQDPANYNSDISKYAKNLKVEAPKKANSILLEPTINELVYDGGTEITVLKAKGVISNGSLVYKVDNGVYTSEPTVTGAGEHTLYYKADETSEYYGISERSMTFSVAKAEPYYTDKPKSKWVYFTGDYQELITAGSAMGGCTVKYALTDINSECPDDNAFSAVIPKAKDIGRYKVWYKIAGNSNYVDSAVESIDVRIYGRSDQSSFDANTGTLTLKGTVRNARDNDDRRNYLILPKDVSSTDVRSLVIDPEGAVFPENCTTLFSGFTALESVDLTGADTSETVVMNEMFLGCTALKTVDLGCTDTSNVTEMKGLFDHCEQLTEIDMSELDTSAVTDMSYMFYNCTALKNIDVSNFDMRNVSTAALMFAKCEGLTSLDLSNLDTSNISKMNEMFSGDVNLVRIYAGSGWSNANAEDGYVFATRKLRWKDDDTAEEYFVDECTSLIGGNGTAYSSEHMGTDYACIDKAGRAGYFTGAYRLTIPDGMEISADAPADKKAGSKYVSGAVIKIRPSDDNTVSGVKANGIPLAEENGEYIITMGYEQINVTVDSITDVLSSFDRNTGTLYLKGKLKKATDNDWENYIKLPEGVVKDEVRHIAVDPSGAEFPEDSENMFYHFHYLESADLRNADTSKVKNMRFMFYDCYNLTYLDLSSFDTRNVYATENMFASCQRLQTLDISSFDTRNVTNMYSMFSGDSSLRTIYAGDNWSAETALANTNNSNASKMLFSGCTSLIGGEGTAYNDANTDAEYARIDSRSKKGYFTGRNISYNVSISECEHGTVTADMTVANKDDIVTLTITPETDYYLSTITVTDSNGSIIDVNDNTFVMPSDNVNITAVFATDKLEEKLYGHSLSLDGDIGVNFYLELGDSLVTSSTAYMLFTVRDGENEYTETVNMRDIIGNVKYENGKRIYAFKCRVNACQMTAQITAQFFDGEKCGKKYTYSVKEYAYNVLTHPDVYYDAIPLVKAMLNYGAYSQICFGYDGTLANEMLYDTDVSDVTKDTINRPFEQWQTNLPENIKLASASLSLKSETTLSLYFISDENLSFNCSGKEVEYERIGKYQVARIRNIPANELNNSFFLNINGNNYVSYSPMNYCYNVLNSDAYDEDLKNVMRALYKYWQTASDYIQ